MRPVARVSINIYIYIETSVRNKCRCSFYCALLTLHVSAPIGGHLQVVFVTQKIRMQLLYEPLTFTLYRVLC
jgi:hypothetical protein